MEERKTELKKQTVLSLVFSMDYVTRKINSRRTRVRPKLTTNSHYTHTAKNVRKYVDLRTNTKTDGSVRNSNVKGT